MNHIVLPENELSDKLKDLEQQYDHWKSNFDFASVPDVESDYLRDMVLNEFSTYKQMSVKEYTLYRKFLEVRDKYKTELVSTLFGDELQLSNATDEKLISNVKNNIWNPSNVDDYMNLEPYLIKTNLDKEKHKIFTILRNFIHTMENLGTIGRQIYYIVADRVTEKYLGVLTIASDFTQLTSRDLAIGWDTDIKIHQGMINHTAIASCIVPTQPFGYNYNGGKLLSLLCLSDEVQRDWKDMYGDTLVGVTTTSLYGDTKPDALSQYDGLEYWERMGLSNGSAIYKLSYDAEIVMRNWLLSNYDKEFFAHMIAHNLKKNGPYVRNNKNRMMGFVFRNLSIKSSEYTSQHKRGIYFAKLYENSYEFLRKDIPETALIKSMDTIISSLTDLWKTKYAKGRISMLKKRNKVLTDVLFYDDLIYLDWNECKDKYISQVGR